MKLRRLTLISTLALGCLAGGITVASAQQAEVIIRTAPPAPRAEARGSLRSGYEWVQGYWRWDGRRHVWVPGHWERARSGYVWEPARWDRRYDGWVFIPGRWVRPGQRPPSRPHNDHGPYDRPGAGPGRPGPGPGAGPGASRYHWERQGWVFLGEQWVSGRGRQTDRDTIQVGRKEGKFHRMMITAEDGDFEMHDVLVTFGNGRTWAPPVRHYFRENSRSRVMELPKAPRNLETVQFTYSNVPGGGRARVQLWAK